MQHISQNTEVMREAHEFCRRVSEVMSKSLQDPERSGDFGSLQESGTHGVAVQSLNGLAEQNSELRESLNKAVILIGKMQSLNKQMNQKLNSKDEIMKRLEQKYKDFSQDLVKAKEAISNQRGSSAKKQSPQISGIHYQKDRPDDSVFVEDILKQVDEKPILRDEVRGATNQKSDESGLSSDQKPSPSQQAKRRTKTQDSFHLSLNDQEDSQKRETYHLIGSNPKLHPNMIEEERFVVEGSELERQIRSLKIAKANLLEEIAELKQQLEKRKNQNTDVINREARSASQRLKSLYQNDPPLSVDLSEQSVIIQGRFTEYKNRIKSLQQKLQKEHSANQELKHTVENLNRQLEIQVHKNQNPLILQNQTPLIQSEQSVEALRNRCAQLEQESGELRQRLGIFGRDRQQSRIGLNQKLAASKTQLRTVFNSFAQQMKSFVQHAIAQIQVDLVKLVTEGFNQMAGIHRKITRDIQEDLKLKQMRLKGLTSANPQLLQQQTASTLALQEQVSSVLDVFLSYNRQVKFQESLVSDVQRLKRSIARLAQCLEDSVLDGFSSHQALDLLAEIRAEKDGFVKLEINAALLGLSSKRSSYVQSTFKTLLLQ